MSATSNWLDSSVNSNLSIQTYIQGFLDISGGNVVLRNNNLFVKTGDVSLGGRLFVTRDLSVNGNLNIGANTIPANAIIGGAGTGGVYWSASGSTWSNGANTSKVAMILDTSAANTLDVSGTISVSNAIGVGVTNPQYQIDVGGGGIGCARYVQWGQGSTPAYNVTTNIISGTFNGLLTTTADTSLNGRLFVSADSSLNGSVAVGGNLTVNGNLSVKAYTQASILNTITTNTFSVVEDLSLNGRFFTSGDASLNGRLFVSGNLGAGVPAPQFPLDISGGTQRSIQNTATYNNFYGKVPPSTVIPSSFSPNSLAAVSSTWINNGVTWSVSASSIYPSNYAASVFGSFYSAPVSNGGTSLCGWNPATASYNGTTATYGQYTGSYYTNINGLGSIYGEWLQIQSSLPVVLNTFNYTTTAYSAANVAASRFLYKFYICGSNDNINWYPIIYGAWNTLPITNTTLSSTSTYTIPSGTSTSITTGQPDTKLTYSTYGNGTNAYIYFRTVVTNTISNNFSQTSGDGAGVYLNFFWTPTFSATQTGPSRTLVYMDASNINQLDVSGSLAVVNTNPSTMTFSPNTANATSYTWQNNGITWTANGSSYFTNRQFYKLFDTKYNTSYANLWCIGSSTNAIAQTYSATSPFAYIGTGGGNFQATTNYSTTIQNSVGAIAGEWVQIQSSVPVVLNSFSFTPNDGTYISACCPGTFYICGSNDGSTWYPIIRGVFGSVPFLVGSTISDVPSPVYNVTTASQSALTVTNTFSSVSNINNSYTNFRLVVTNVMGTLGGASFDTGNNATSIGLQFAEWTPYFIPVTSSVSLALDNAVPNQLNLGGGLSVNGALGVTGALSVNGALGVTGALSVANTLSVAGGITPIYATPSFTSGQIGYIYTSSTLITTVALTGSYTLQPLVQITGVAAGIYFAYANLAFNAVAGTVSLTTDFGSGEYSLYSGTSGLACLNISGIITNTASNTTNLITSRVGNGAATTCTSVSFKIIRIA